MNVNDLFVTIEEFSQIACLDGHLFNVHTACEKCSGTNVTACLRPHVEQKLLAVQEIAERRVGYNFTRRYHEETITWPGFGARVQLKWPGVIALDVGPVSTLLSSRNVTAYSIQDVEIQVDGSGICVAVVPSALVENPRMAIFREAANGSRVAQVEQNGYPRRDGSNWLIALDGRSVPTPCDKTIHVQHCRMIAIEGPAETCVGRVEACYPGTDRIIPMAKPPQVVGLQTLYWYWAWSLVDPAFQEEEVNLEGLESYKLLQTVDFRCFSEEDRYSRVLNMARTSWGFCCNQNEDSIVYQAVDYTIIDAQESIVELKSNGLLDCANPVSLTIYYLTDPEASGYDDQLPAMRDAIAHMVAAELPLALCGCKIDEHIQSYISTAQTPYSKIILNPFSGEVYTNQHYGDLYGQRVFSARLDRARKHKVSVVI